MALLGKHIKLTGISQKGKNRVREHGNHWVVLAETDKILFNPEPGPWLFIAPLGCGQNDKASRWVRAGNDENFSMEEM
jgi:hypothetical protein